MVLLAIKNRLHVLDEAAKAPASLRSARAQEVKDPLFGRKQRSKRYRSPTPFPKLEDSPPIIKEDSSEEAIPSPEGFRRMQIVEDDDSEEEEEEVEEEAEHAASTDGFEVAAGEQDAEVEDSQRGTP